jgi:hypothetical protein
MERTHITINRDVHQKSTEQAGEGKDITTKMAMQGEIK